MNVAFLGLGAIGYPMARRVAEAGFGLAVWNRSAEKSAELARITSARAASTPADAVRGMMVVVTCLPTSEEVEAVTFGSDGIASAIASGALLVDCTSGDPHVSRFIARRLAEQGVDFLDAPVSGGVVGAEAGKLTVMCGGDAAVLERARPVLQAFGAKIILCGPTGAGHAIKALSNALLAIHLWSTGEALVAAAKAGVAPAIALDVINGSAGRSNSSENLIPQRVLTREFPSTFRLALLDKDVRIAEAVAHEAGTPAGFIELAHRLFERAHAELGEEVDHTAALQVL
ncbi:MAG TPA: NAD(P)-dependent oxidoreductase, partial [Candidatus Limnocylindria bacterium]|nr:NAD(P)-dependent oxidoreductase [Candidatus Limnocylindria bacterium]